ncbi:DNA mismatch repair protein [Chitinophaga sp. SYP-B3965]|uniref:MutS-related protein n=1 Tax=Chitinophaga sp. SYP-B3965 TaxID=2663120 RepID=UPI001299C58E|nr:DNA mismatch repair protein [Chitinophaga sp. SYP-B3965]MRG44399.1 DNA mismatch repair protein [Chitinophaga sp. SYP-B3965]
MSFFADKQTLNDLNIPGRHKNNSISRLFDTVITMGGRKLMDHLFQHPLTDAEEINQRSSIFRYFSTQPVTFPFTAEEFAVMENYLSAGGSNIMHVLSKKVLQIVAQDTAYEQLNGEICKTIEMLNHFRDFAEQLQDREGAYKEQLELIGVIFRHPKLSWLQQERGVNSLSLVKLVKYDHLLRTAMHAQMKQLMTLIFHLDVYVAVSAIGRQRRFNYAVALPKSSNKLTITDLYHPAVENAIGNTVSLSGNKNVIFLTGANMAGKSTLMKSFGICVYLAHMGFPVAASQMEFSVMDGLYTSINVPDSLELGYSHFYAEVLRVKTVAEEVAADKDLYVIFDELFKGTNVKDAYDATLSITEAFSENRNCFFIISTHIIEVGEALREQCDNFSFTYLPTIMEGHKPTYTYKLTEGITQDRQGMIIIENEGILEIVKGG